MVGSVVVVTGANGEVGAALARELGRRGAHVLLVAPGDSEVDQLGPASEPLLVVADVSSPDGARRIADAALARFGQIDVWINVGLVVTQPVSQLSAEEVGEAICANVRSGLHGIQAILPHFKQRGRGHIIDVSLTSALTDNLRHELRETHPGIRVSAFAPLPVAEPPGQAAEAIAALIERSPAAGNARHESRAPKLRWVPLATLALLCAAAVAFALRPVANGGRASGSKREGAAALKVTVTPSDATALVDGGPIDLRGPLTLAAGVHALAVTRDGYRQVYRAIELAPGEHVEVRVTLEPMERNKKAYRRRSAGPPPQLPPRVDGEVYLEFKAR